MSAERSAIAAVAAGGSQEGIAAEADCGSDTTLLGAGRPEVATARQIRARALVAGLPPAQIAAAIASECGSSRIRAFRLALGIALADVVAQVRARYEADGRHVPRFSETLLSAYEGGQKRPGPEYLHYLCATYQTDPADLGFAGRCLCGRSHRPERARHPDLWPGARPAGPDGASVLPSVQASAGFAATEDGDPRLVPESAERPGRPAPGHLAPGHLAPGHPVPGCSAAEVAASVCPAEAGGGAPDPAVGKSGGPMSANAASVPARLGSLPVAGPEPDSAGLRTARGTALGPAYGPGTACLPGWEAQAALAALQPDASVSMRADCEEDDDALRHMLLRQMAEPGSPVESRFLGAVDRIRRRMDEALLGGTVSPSMIDRWEQSVVGYGRQYMRVPPLRLLCDVLLDLADVRRMCEERQPLEFADRLCRLASQLAGLAGIAMLDLGDHRLARAFFRTARAAADETGDRQLRAWVSVREALVPLYYGDPREAAGLASAAGDLAGRRLSVAAVMAPVLEARARARLVALGAPGRREALERARASLDWAHDALADLPPGQTGDTALGYTERQLYFHTGDILVGLGDWQGAHRAFGQAGQLYASAEVLDCALVAFGQARCLLESDEPGQALAVGRDILAGLPAEHRTDVVLQVARTLGQDVAARDLRLPALAGYREAVQTACPEAGA